MHDVLSRPRVLLNVIISCFFIGRQGMRGALVQKYGDFFIHRDVGKTRDKRRTCAGDYRAKRIGFQR